MQASWILVSPIRSSGGHLTQAAKDRRSTPTDCRYLLTVRRRVLEVAANPRHLGAEISAISILHTWGQNLLLHPHVHCVVPAGGISPDHTRWIRPRYPFFLPVKVLSRVFRGKFCSGLKRLFRLKQLRCAGPASLFAEPKQFYRLLRRLHRRDWVVYAKPQSTR